MGDQPDIARGRTFDPARTRWHLMFVLDSTETIVDGAGSKSFKVFDDAMLRQLVDNRAREISINEKRGTVMQPKPVSANHAIARRLFLGEDVPDAQLRRTGNDYDLHYYEGGELGPAGVYSLVEWTRDEWAAIGDGSSMVLSPVTVRGYAMTDDYTIEGVSIQEIGTVDVPKLDSIGTTRDGLPWDAFGPDATDARPHADSPEVVEARYRAPIWRTAAPLSEVVMRRGLFVDAVIRAAEPADTTTEDPTPDKEVDMLTDEMKAEVAEMIANGIAEYAASMNAAEPGAEIVEDVEGVETRSADPEVVAEPSIEQIEDDRIDAELRSLVTDGKLLASRVGMCRKRMKAGEGIGDLVGDFGAVELRARAPQGAPTASTNDASDDGPKVVMYSKVVADAEATVPAQAGGRRNAVALNDAIKTRTAELRAKGVTINMEQ